jgi:hypothetical protein
VFVCPCQVSLAKSNFCDWGTLAPFGAGSWFYDDDDEEEEEKVLYDGPAEGV